MRTYIAKPEIIRDATGKVAADLKLPTDRGNAPQLLIGRKEWISLPEFGIGPIHAKTDSGARSSSLHVEDIREFERDGKDWVAFKAFDYFSNTTECEAPIVAIKHVKSSSGSGDHRVFIETVAEIGQGFRWKVLISLTDRSSMKHDMLLGRRALAGNFLIDCHRSHLLGRIAGI